MVKQLSITKTSNIDQKYGELSVQLGALIGDEKNLYANLANVSAALKQAFDFFWVGFYLVDTPDELVLGPFQGPIACTRIKKSQGVCGACWEQGKTIIVDNVDNYPGHIACSTESKSEIVIPVFQDNKVIAILDIDSNQLDYFNAKDAVGLEKICQIISDTL
ncbi:MAG: GAF domain-containing protein [Crocinitomicaceae bacterium]|jgi:L-methionine (R)-S-oxide reductase|nr:GAF domain-containing protein [Crocinitomicaceae bacterium]MBT5403345.1 GAF domain-containing protein [Crocinitomicaceae bacterium]MBT6030552.1 GAF domain-containing protein [Crocinitomicaceae bacterium]MBT6514738.1 GAF domain-containing protein [Crocinitomicaceae bacterium]